MVLRGIPRPCPGPRSSARIRPELHPQSDSPTAAFRPSRPMSDTAAPNAPRGVRPNFPKRPAMDEDAWSKIQREQEKMKEREFVRFAVLKLDPAWRRLPKSEREAHKDEFEQMVGEWGRKM